LEERERDIYIYRTNLGHHFSEFCNWFVAIAKPPVVNGTLGIGTQQHSPPLPYWALGSSSCEWIYNHSYIYRYYIPIIQ
jgi:hypothetical protein